MGTPYVDPDRLFRCEAPAGWERFSDNETQTKNVSFQLTAPKDKGSGERASFLISIYYYAPDSPNFRTPDEYIATNTLSGPEQTATSVEDLQLNAGPAKRWNVFGPGPSSPETGSEGRRKETFVVVGAPKGFFALIYSSPEVLYKAHTADFYQLLDSFSLLVSRSK
jgi:hypothetical protein